MSDQSAHRRAAIRVLPTLAAFALALSPAAAATALSVEDLVPRTPAVESPADEQRGADKPAAGPASKELAPGKLKGGKVVQTGWWGASNQQAPETGLLAPPSTPPFLAPEDSIPVAAIGGNVERVTAIEFKLAGKPDSSVRKLELALAPVEDPSANPNGDQGVMYACTLTETFFVGVANGPWETRPSWDCNDGLAVAGVLGEDDGVWRFDLTTFAQDWLSSTREFAPAVMLVSELPENAPEAEPGSESAPTFQVAFDGAEGIGLTAKTKAPAKTDDEATSDETPETEGEGEVDASAGGAGGGGGAFSGGGDLGGGAPLDSGPIDEAPVDAGAPLEEAAVAAGASSPQLTPVAAGPLAWHHGLGRSIILLVPILMIAYLVMVAMGPAGQPGATGGNGRGVSRALDRLAQGGVTRLGRNS